MNFLRKSAILFFDIPGLLRGGKILPYFRKSPLYYERKGFYMYKILKRRQLNENVVLMEVDAPFIAKKALAGQFIILRVDEKGERIPLTIADYDREKGTVTIIFQIVGQTTMLLSQLKEGDALLDFVGPLGKATDF